MKKVICVGCGLMGSALINGFMDGGHKVAIVNRTEAKASEFIKRGASYYSKLSEAIKDFNPDLIELNLDSYENDSIYINEASELIEGKTVVNLSTGSSDKVVEFKELIDSLGGRFIAGVITCYPQNIGAKKDGSLVYAGDETGYKEVEDILGALSPTNIYMGEDVIAAPTMDTAWLTAHYGLYWGLVQAAAACKKNNISVETYADAIKPMIISLLDVVCPNLKEIVAKDNYDGASDCTLDIQEAAIKEIMEYYTSHDMDGTVLGAIGNLAEKAVKNGDGDKNFEAIARNI